MRRQLQRDYREEDLRSEGLRIFTTLDPWSRRPPRRRYHDGSRVGALARVQGGTLESAAVVASAAQGEVLALVGGRESGYAGFNRALEAVRPIGSLIKPVIYLTALSDPERYSLAHPARIAP